MRTNLVVAVAAFAALAGLWLSRRPDTAPADAHALVAAGARLVDVRSAAEFAAGHLPGAINLPVDELGARLDEVGPRDKPVVVYCAVGGRAARAARLLGDAGFRAVHNLGAMSNW